jgi:hypothetical protein
MPCHHNLEEYLTAYLDGAELRTEAGCRSRGVEFAPDSPLEEDGFEPSVPLVSRGAIRREFPKRGARLAASWGVELRRRSSIWEFDPTSRDQTRGILLRHLDDAIQADGDMPV